MRCFSSHVAPSNPVLRVLSINTLGNTNVFQIIYFKCASKDTTLHVLKLAFLYRIGNYRKGVEEDKQPEQSPSSPKISELLRKKVKYRLV